MDSLKLKRFSYYERLRHHAPDLYWRPSTQRLMSEAFAAQGSAYFDLLGVV